MSAGMWKARGGSRVPRASIQQAPPLSSSLFMASTCAYMSALVKVGRMRSLCFFTNSAGIDCTHDGQEIMLEAQTQREQRRCSVHTFLGLGHSL